MLYSSSLRRLSCLRFLGCNTESGNKAASGKRKAEVGSGKWEVTKILPVALLYLYQYIFFKLER